MNEFIELTKVGAESKPITINTNNIIYFKPSKHSRNKRTEILVNGVERPFIVEECYEDVKSKIYYTEDSYGKDDNTKDNENETEDNKELNIIMDDRYRCTIGDYLEYNNYFIDYRKLYNDRDYCTFYKNFMETHIFEISENIVAGTITEKSIGYLHFKMYKDSSIIVMYMTDSYDAVYNEIFYTESDYMGCDIISIYLEDCIKSSNVIFNKTKMNKDYKLDVCLREDLFVK